MLSVEWKGSPDGQSADGSWRYGLLAGVLRVEATDYLGGPAARYTVVLQTSAWRGPTVQCTVTPDLAVDPLPAAKRAAELALHLMVLNLEGICPGNRAGLTPRSCDSNRRESSPGAADPWGP